MSKKLTARQVEIKGLLDRGRTAPEVAARLGITTNAVYQQIRRIRDREGTARAPRSNAGRSKSKPQRQSPAPATEARSHTGLAAPVTIISKRRQEIAAQLSANEAEAKRLSETTAKRLAQIKADDDNLRAEADRLELAAMALSGKLKQATRARRTRRRTATKRSQGPRPASSAVPAKPQPSDDERPADGRQSEATSNETPAAA